MKIAIIGVGYVGLVTAAVFADLGNQVWAVDIDKEKIDSLKKGIVPFYEPGLKEKVNKNLKEGRLHFTSSYQESIPQVEMIFICVGTPAKKNGDYDLTYVYDAAAKIGENLKKYAVVVIKSTVPPTTGKEVRKIIKKKTKVNFDIASCPEFLKEGSALYDALHPSRIVIGVDSEKAKNLLLKLHHPIKAPLLISDIESAQLIKYAANAFLAAKISFINSIARICDKVGADIDKVSLGLGLDPRIGNEFLKAGLGYGGSCFPKDTWALISYAKRLGYNFNFLKEVDKINNSQINWIVKKIINFLGGSLENKTITVLGLSFKPHTDDLRESQSLKLINALQKLGAKVNAYDPVAMNKAKRILQKVKLFKNPYSALKGSYALILATEWSEFNKLNFQKVAKIMKNKLIIDGRNMFDPFKIKKLGFIYWGVGRH